MTEKLDQLKAEATALIRAPDVQETLNDGRVKFHASQTKLKEFLQARNDAHTAGGTRLVTWFT